MVRWQSVEPIDHTSPASRNVATAAGEKCGTMAFVDPQAPPELAHDELTPERGALDDIYAARQLLELFELGQHITTWDGSKRPPIVTQPEEIPLEQRRS